MTCTAKARRILRADRGGSIPLVDLGSLRGGGTDRDAGSIARNPLRFALQSPYVHGILKLGGREMPRKTEYDRIKLRMAGDQTFADAYRKAKRDESQRKRDSKLTPEALALREQRRLSGVTGKKRKVGVGRNRARQAVKQALKVGTLVKLPCRDCGKLEVQAHHPDYDKPLEVIWLCLEHHIAEHRQRGDT